MNEAATMFNCETWNGAEDELYTFDSALRSQGWIKNGFVLSFYFLKIYQNYEQSDEEFFAYTLRRAIGVGGDTDTNGCIVMGMIGALVGFNKIPKNLLGNVLSFDCTQECIKRDNFLSVKFNAVPLINDIIQKRAQPGDRL